MALPNWLVQATGAMKFANNPANGFQPTMGDAMQGIGHSMMNHYRNGQGTPPAGGAPQPAPPPAPMFAAGLINPSAPPVPVDQLQLPQVSFNRSPIDGLSSKTIGLIADLFKK